MAEQTQPSEAEKKLQRELQKARDQNRDLNLKLMALDQNVQCIKDVEEKLDVLLSEVSSADAEAGQKLSKIEENKQSRAKVYTSYGELINYLMEHGIDQDDPQYEEVRKFSGAGDYAKALESAKKAQGGDGIDAAVEAALAKRDSAKKKVDGGGTVGTPGLPTDPTELRERLKDKAWVAEHRKELLQGYKQGVVR